MGPRHRAIVQLLQRCPLPVTFAFILAGENVKPVTTVRQRMLDRAK